MREVKGFKVTRHDFQRLEDGRIDTNNYTKREVEYFFRSVGSSLIVQRDGIKKVVRVTESDKYVYKLNKTCISAQGGADGLFDFLAREADFEINLYGEMLSTIVLHVLDYVMDTCKAYVPRW